MPHRQLYRSLHSYSQTARAFLLGAFETAMRQLLRHRQQARVCSFLSRNIALVLFHCEPSRSVSRRPIFHRHGVRAERWNGLEVPVIDHIGPPLAHQNK